MKLVTDPNQIKVGDRVRIIKYSGYWNQGQEDRLECPNKILYPIEFQVKIIKKTNSYKLNWCISDGKYGFSLMTSIQQGLVYLIDSNLTYELWN